MTCKNALCFAAFLALLLLGTSSQFLKASEASENQDVEFGVIDRGDISRYVEETYFVIRTEAEWAKAWEKHTVPYVPKIPYPKINFFEKMVICAFMGERPTTGYSISVERIWVEEEKIYVEIAKSSPPKNAVVGEVLTYPYVFVSLERIDMEVIFHVTEENGTIVEYTLPEFPMMAFALAVFVVLSGALVALKCKAKGTS